jgi:hypothetical protein
MAYMNQEKKAKIAPAVKAVLAKYKVKGTLAVRNRMTLVLNIKSGAIDFIENYIETDINSNHANKMSQEKQDYIRNKSALDVNPYWYTEHFTGKTVKFLEEIFAALKGEDWYDNTDAQIDYFDTAYYVDVHVGQWDKPYLLTK